MNKKMHLPVRYINQYTEYSQKRPNPQVFPTTLCAAMWFQLTVRRVQRPVKFLLPSKCPRHGLYTTLGRLHPPLHLWFGGIDLQP